MSNPPNGYNTNTAFNKFKGTYYNSDIDVSGGNIISRTGNLYLAPNSSIFTESNQILFNEEFQFTDFVNNVNVLGQLKNTYNAIEYDVGLQCEKVDTLVTDVGTISPIVYDTQFKTTGFYWDAGLSTTVFNNNASFPNASISSTAINNTSFVSKSGAESIDGIKTFNSAPVMSGASITNGTISSNKITGTACNLISTQTISGLKTYSVLQTYTSNIRLDGSLLVGTAGATTITNAQLQQIVDIPTLKTITTAISYTPATTTTLISGVLQWSGSLNGWDTTNFYNAINYSRTATSDLQTQINNFTGVSLSANNTFTGSNIFSQTLRLQNNLRLDGALIVNNNGTTITNATLVKVNYLSNVTSDINTSISNLNTKTTNISFAGLTTSFGGQLSFPLNSISSGAIINDNFVALTGAQSVGGTKTYTSQVIFSNNIRLDTGSLILSSNTLTLTNANLQKIQFLSTVSSDIQTQINGINAISLSASNVFTGATNQFSNTLRLDGALNLNANALIIPNTTLQKLQYISTISSDIQSQTTTNANNITTANTNITTNTNNITTNTNNITTNTNNITTNTTSINTINTKLTNVSFSSPTTTISNTLSTSTLTFSSTLNNISTTVFGYLSGLTENIKTSLDNLSARITNVEIVGTIIMSPLNDLQTTTSNKYLACNGLAVSRTTYSALFAKFGELFGAGNGTTTFNLPNYQGMFLRGMGNQILNNVNYGNYNSTYQPDPDSIQNHTHSGQAGAYLGTNTTLQSIGYMASMNYAPASYSFANTGNMSAGRINDFETKPVSIGIYYYVRT